MDNNGYPSKSLLTVNWKPRLTTNVCPAFYIR